MLHSCRIIFSVVVMLNAETENGATDVFIVLKGHSVVAGQGYYIV